VKPLGFPGISKARLVPLCSGALSSYAYGT
jgi:hypothetical protein